MIRYVLGWLMFVVVWSWIVYTAGVICQASFLIFAWGPEGRLVISLFWGLGTAALVVAFCIAYADRRE